VGRSADPSRQSTRLPRRGRACIRHSGEGREAAARGSCTGRRGPRSPLPGPEHGGFGQRYISRLPTPVLDPRAFLSISLPCSRPGTSEDNSSCFAVLGVAAIGSVGRLCVLTQAHHAPRAILRAARCGVGGDGEATRPALMLADSQLVCPPGTWPPWHLGACACDPCCLRSHAFPELSGGTPSTYALCWMAGRLRTLQCRPRMLCVR